MPQDKPHIFFSPEEVNVLIPQLETHFQNFWSCRQNAQRILEGLREKARNAMPATPLRISQNQIRQSQAHFLLEQGRKELEMILEIGGVIKDLEIGIVDFPHMLEFEEEKVYLCWRFGEKKVRFWHSVHEGFSDRKSLSRRVHHSR